MVDEIRAKFKGSGLVLTDEGFVLLGRKILGRFASFEPPVFERKVKFSRHVVHQWNAICFNEKLIKILAELGAKVICHVDNRKLSLPAREISLFPVVQFAGFEAQIAVPLRRWESEG